MKRHMWSKCDACGEMKRASTMVRCSCCSKFICSACDHGSNICGMQACYDCTCKESAMAEGSEEQRADVALKMIPERFKSLKELFEQYLDKKSAYYSSDDWWDYVDINSIELAAKFLSLLPDNISAPSSSLEPQIDEDSTVEFDWDGGGGDDKPFIGLGFADGRLNTLSAYVRNSDGEEWYLDCEPFDMNSKEIPATILNALKRDFVE